MDPLVHHGRHFGRTIHALCNVNALVVNGILRLQALAEQPDEDFSAQYGYWFLLLFSNLFLYSFYLEGTTRA